MKTKKILSIVTLFGISLSLFVCSSPMAAATGQTFALGALQDNTPSISDKPSSGGVCATNLPTSVDLSQDKYFPPIGSQGEIGSCASWASTYYQFTYQVARLNNWDAKNDATKRFSPRWTYNFCNYNSDQTKHDNCGSFFRDNYTILKYQGAARFTEFPPTEYPNNIDTENKTWCLDTSVMRNALKTRISDFKEYNFADSSVNTPITSYDDTDLNQIKTFLATGNVLTFCTDFYTWDYKTLSNNEIGCIKVYDDNSQWDGHALTIVGYDDTISYDLNGDGIIEPYEKGAFKIANSWGSEYYKNNGFVWLMYDALNKVSNTSVQQVANREAAFDNYSYNYIQVQNYTPQLIGDITLSQTSRNEINLSSGMSDVASTLPTTTFGTALCPNELWIKSDPIGFNGIDNTRQDATFLMDFSMYNSGSQRSNYYATVADTTANSNNTIVKNIRLEDKNNSTILNLPYTTSIDGSTCNFKYRLGKYGDVDNNGLIDTNDITRIQQYMASQVTLSSDDLKAADVNGDGVVSLKDASKIQQYLSNVITTFPAGILVYLG
ncbi:MAG: dockerin type I domain-containing protein [Bacillota bacterium]|nr:dockerin type I domain-containing protein [Bacillota bacterium]